MQEVGIFKGYKVRIVRFFKKFSKRDQIMLKTFRRVFGNEGKKCDNLKKEKCFKIWQNYRGECPQQYTKSASSH